MPGGLKSPAFMLPALKLPAVERMAGVKQTHAVFEVDQFPYFDSGDFGARVEPATVLVVPELNQPVLVVAGD